MYTNKSMNQKIISKHEKVYRSALLNRFITTQEAGEIVGKDETARVILWRLVQRGRLQRIRGGLYAAVPPESVGGAFEVDKYLLLSKAMRGKGALAFHSALELHGVAYSSFNEVYGMSEIWIPRLSFQGVRYRVVRTENLFGTATIFRDDVPLLVTDKERTFLDCVRRPDLSGGLEEIVKSYSGFRQLSPVLLLDYLARFDEDSLYQRAGYFLELLQREIKVPDDLILALQGHVSKVRYPLVAGSGKSGLVRDVRWNVLFPSNISEVIRSV